MPLRCISFGARTSITVALLRASDQLAPLSLTTFEVGISERPPAIDRQQGVRNGQGLQRRTHQPRPAKLMHSRNVVLGSGTYAN